MRPLGVPMQLGYRQSSTASNHPSGIRIRHGVIAAVGPCLLAAVGCMSLVACGPAGAEMQGLAREAVSVRAGRLVFADATTAGQHEPDLQ